MAAPRQIHREDIKAAIRKQFGSLLAFERIKQLGNRSTTDALMGRRRPSTAKAIADVVGHNVSDLFPGVYESAIADDRPAKKNAHRKNAEVR